MRKYLKLFSKISNPCNKIVLFWGLAIWCVLVFAGLGVLLNYETKPSTTTEAPSHWPVHSVLPEASGKYRMIMALHPYCACSRASLRELNIILTRTKKIPVTVYLLVYQPEHLDSVWSKTDLWHQASQFKAANLILDKNGKIAKLFNTPTSGQVLLYNSQGQLMFNGGITSSRGHEGDNSGRDAIISILKQENTTYKHTFVFGCPILNPNRSDNNV